MLHLFTVDLIADEVSRELLGGTPSRRLLHRFFRKGRRDGKRAHDPATVALLIRESVNLAAAGLCADYVAHRDELVRELVHLEVVAARSPQPPPMEAPSASDPKDFLPAATDLNLPHAGSGHPGDGDAILRAALVRRRMLRAERKKVRLEIELEARNAAALEASQRAVHQVEEAIELRVEKMGAAHRMRAQFVERFNAIAFGGSLLWARYCNGFEQGHTGRRSRGSVVQPPREPLGFDVPDVLIDDDWAGAVFTAFVPAATEDA